jgi:3-hydroxyisobutyrate dehydrogenase
LTEQLTQTVAVVGFGAMGTRMASRLVGAGCGVIAVDPSPQARARAEVLGISGHDDMSSLPTCDLVIVLVATGAQLLDTVKSGSTHRDVRGETWMICSTVGPQVAREASAALADAGATVLDAPVTGGVVGAENGTLRFLIAGAPEAIRHTSEVLAVLGTLCAVGEQPGDGQATKIVNQLCSSVHLAVAAEAVALAIRLGLDPVTTVGVLSGGSGASPLFDDRGPRMARPDGCHAVLTRLAILAKDNDLVEQEADAHGAHVPLLKAAKQQYQLAAELGLLDADDSQIIRTYLDSPLTKEPIQ